jgi:hypothetical protein
MSRYTQNNRGVLSTGMTPVMTSAIVTWDQPAGELCRRHPQRLAAEDSVADLCSHSL